MSALPRRLLIANRGEIACRIIRTARRLGIATVAVHSDADRDARHVRLADQAVRIGPAAARQSYLDIGALLAAARASGADAVHPGYGFLSENADFAAACAAAGLVFVGPPPAAIRAMGSKSEAKRLLEDAGVPLTPGYHGERQDEATLLAEADRIGWPLLIKASAGGGGKGIRRVDRREDFAAALAACQREAAAAFGDARVLIERCILRPRHIEVQVFADTHGGAIHLGERDCSIQRRHQKVLEEAPSPGMTAERRAAMGQAAVNAALLLDEAAADPSSAGHRGGGAQGASPWAARDGFRLAGVYQRRVTLASTTNGEERRVLQVSYAADGWQVTFDDAAASSSTGGTAAGGDTVALRATHEADGMLALGIDGHRLLAQTFVHDGVLHVRVDGRQAAVAFIDPREPSGGDEAAEGGLRSPMPGRVVVLHVRAGDRVKRGAPLLAIEAMKMEHVITAPADGVVEAVHVTEGAQVAEGVTLVDFSAD